MCVGGGVITDCPLFDDAWSQGCAKYKPYSLIVLPYLVTIAFTCTEITNIIWILLTDQDNGNCVEILIFEYLSSLSDFFFTCPRIPARHFGLIRYSLSVQKYYLSVMC